MSSTTEKIKERLSIIDVLSSYITIEKAGGSLKARCPFHQEKTPSFFISPERNTYYCFGCGAKGDIFSFVQEFESLDFLGALKVLADKAGVTIESFEKGTGDTKKRIFDCLEEATLFFQQELKKNNEALIYLKKRGLAIEIVRDWRIGFAPDDWHILQKHLQTKNFTLKEIEEAGLIKQGEKGNEYARFRGRIMFPIFDGSSRVVAFSGRILHGDASEAKYINSPETLVFEKSKILFGYNKAKREMKEKGFTILVEGQMDLLLSHQAGFGNTVASSGTAFTFEQAEIIKRLSDEIYIAYDSDKAGQNASFRAWKIALRSGLKVKAVTLPEGLDPADAILKDKNIWQKAIESAKSIIEYYIEMLESGDEKRRDEIIKDKILPLVAFVESSIDQARFLQHLSQKTGIPENSLREEMQKIPKSIDDESEVSKREIVTSKAVNGIRRKAIALSFYLKEHGIAESEKFNTELERILEDVSVLEKGIKDEKDAILFEAEMHYANSPNFSKIITDTLYLLEDEILKEKFASSMERLKRVESAGDIKAVEVETMYCHEITKKLSELKAKYFNKD